MLRPMLKVEVVCSLLHSLVSEHKERGEDPTEALSSPALLETIAQVKNLAGNSKEMDQFQTVRNGAGTKACTISLAWIVDLIMGLRGLCRCRPTLTSCPERNFLVASASWTRPPSKNIWRFLHAHIYRYACLLICHFPFPYYSALLIPVFFVILRQLNATRSLNKLALKEMIFSQKKTSN